MSKKKFKDFSESEPQFKPCEYCEGTGKEQEYTGGPLIPCINCDGHGIIVMTEEEMQADHESRLEESYEY